MLLLLEIKMSALEPATVFVQPFVQYPTPPLTPRPLPPPPQPLPAKATHANAIADTKARLEKDNCLVNRLELKDTLTPLDSFSVNLHFYSRIAIDYSHCEMLFSEFD